MNNQKTFGQTIRNYREARGLLLRQLAAALEVDTAFISKMERDEKQATRTHVERLASVLKVANDELLTIWLSDKLLNTLEQEPSAYNALKLTEKRLKSKAI
ncbi:helix-turn-helix domain-containing protein [Flavobacterium aurantiibacter]|uniref:Transcriptional regulator n=1 Tax=Flavobacterium aurantiibacter TaxID=2023067 RepID=A0A255ZQS4_9FLAO|nr:helix-turn-helix domain-containing protein [Flavobacterium aurantiibacter]OYQ43858.1 transcriptional regulator [Flavobacterium aurantiibacter]